MTFSVFRSLLPKPIVDNARAYYGLASNAEALFRSFSKRCKNGGIVEGEIIGLALARSPRLLDATQVPDDTEVELSYQPIYKTVAIAMPNGEIVAVLDANAHKRYLRNLWNDVPVEGYVCL